jgi:hypothetical protein
VRPGTVQAHRSWAGFLLSVKHRGGSGNLPMLAESWAWWRWSFLEEASTIALEALTHHMCCIGYACLLFLRLG